MGNFFSRRGRDGGEKKEPEEEKKAQPARPFSSSRLSGGDSPPARSGGGSGDDEKKSTSERGTPFGRTSMFSRSEPEKKDESEEPRARPAGVSGRPETPNRFGIRSTSENERAGTGREPESPYTRRFSGETRRTDDSEERKEGDSSFGSRYSPYRRESEERREGGESASRFGSSYRRPDAEERRESTDPASRTGSFRRPSPEEKKDEPGSRFGTFRRETDDKPAEKKEEPGSRFGSTFRRSTPDDKPEEKKDEPTSRFGSFRRETTTDKPVEKKEESGSRFGSAFRRAPAEEKKPEEKKEEPTSRFGSFRRETTADKPAEKKEEPGSRFGSTFRRTPTEEKKPEEKKDEPTSRFGSFRRETTADKPAEKKEEAGSRFGSALRRAPAEEKKPEEKKEEPTSRFSSVLRRAPAEEKKPEEKKEEGGGRFVGWRRGETQKEEPKKEETGGSRLGGLLRRPGAPATEEKKETPKPPSMRATTTDRPAAPSGTAKPPSTRSSAAPSAPAKPATPAAKPKSNRAAAKPLPTGKDRLPKLVKAGPSLDFQLDMVGAALAVAALILLSGFISPGAATGVVDDYLAQLFGIGRLLVPVVVGGIGLWLLVSRFGNAMFDIEYFRIFGAMLLFIIVMATLQWGYLFTEAVPSYDVLEQNSDALWRNGQAGGILGHIVYIFFARQLGDYAVVVFFFFWWAFALMLLFKTSPSQIVEQGRNVRHSLQVRQEAARARREARRVDVAALAAAEVAAPPAAQRAPQTVTGRTTTPEQDQAKAAETPARQTAETQAAEEKPSRLGRLFRGGKVEAEKVEAEGRPATSEVAQEQRQRRFGLPGRRVAPPPSESQPEEAKTPPPVETEKPTASRWGLLNRRRQEEAQPEENSSEQVAGRRVSLDKAETADEKKEEVAAVVAGNGAARFGRLLRRSETSVEQPAAEGVQSQEAAGGRFRLGSNLFQRHQPEEKPTAEQPAEAQPESAAPKRLLGGITGRWAGRNKEETPEKSETDVRQPAEVAAGRTSDNQPEGAPQRRPAGVMGRLSGDAVAAVPESEKTPPTPTQPQETPVVEPEKQPDVLQESGIGSRLSAMRARQLAGQSEQPSLVGRRPDVVQESTERKEGEYPRRHMPSREMPIPVSEERPPAPTESVAAVEAPAEVNKPADTDAKTDEPAAPEIKAEETPAVQRDPFQRHEFDRPARPMGLRRSFEIQPSEKVEVVQPSAEATPPVAAELKADKSSDKKPEAETPISPSVENETKTPSDSPAQDEKEWKLPPFMTLLEPGSDQEVDQHYLLEQARIIEDTLSSFGAPGKVVEVNSGPVITQFGVEPDYMERRGGRTRVKVSAIAALEKDIALALAAKTIRVEAPVPGKGFVGIEVPNAKAALVSLRDVMSSDAHQKMQQKSPLAIGLGQAVDGAPISADLTAMPHLLIAGTTGSGKSVCVNAIISCLLLQNTPTELQMIMVDPKRVELTGYNGIPHLISNVVVDLERIVGVLKWVQREMDERYRKLNERGARNIQDYNRRAPEGSKIPYLVVIIDELADLMMLAPDETEKLIARLAQMARATGIHLIISTQRPSVDVVTGLIKANFPARIAFAVASGTDSRVILDAPGADRLLGKGDMLFQSPDASAPVRMQGVYVSDMEIERITRYWKEQAVFVKRGSPTANLLKLGDEPHRPAQMPVSRTERFGSEIRPERQQNFWKEVDALAAEREGDDLPDGEDDDMYEEAVNIVRQLEKASISLLQRRLRIGYTRAARLIDLMESRGVIGPATESGSKPRDVLPSSYDE